MRTVRNSRFRRSATLGASVGAALLGASAFAGARAGAVPHVGAQALVLTSTVFDNGARMPRSTVYDRDGCAGRNASPELRWSGVPATTRSFALTVHDPDAKHPGGWWHWVRFNIPSRARELRAGDRAAGTDGTNSFGRVGYGGPCPPPGSGIHHYQFVLYALDVPHLSASAQTGADALVRMLHGHTLATGNLVGTYSR